MSNTNNNEEVWSASAACFGTDIDFYSNDKDEVDRALSLCEQCPVRKACLQEALNNTERFGVWGGATAKELRRDQSIDVDGKSHVFARRVRCPYCGPRSTSYLRVLSPPRRTRTHIECTNCGINFWTKKVINRRRDNF